MWLFDILLEIPNDTSAQLRCDFYEYTRSSLHVTPQAAGNRTQRDLTA